MCLIKHKNFQAYNPASISPIIGFLNYTPINVYN